MKQPDDAKPALREGVQPEVKIDLTSPPDAQQAEMPHERDQSVGMTDGVPSATVQQGHRDVERGLKDTSRSNEADAAYRKLKQ